jgi:hypothetical protein
MGGVWAKSDSMAFIQQLCCWPKDKIEIKNFFVDWHLLMQILISTDSFLFLPCQPEIRELG